jgi:hypothetical protein
VKKGVLVEVEKTMLDRYWRGWRWGESLEGVGLHRFRVDQAAWKQVKDGQGITPEWKPEAKPQTFDEILFPGAPEVDGTDLQILKLIKESGPTWVSSKSVGMIFERCGGLVRKGALVETADTKIDKFLVGLRHDERVLEVVLHRYQITEIGEKLVAAATGRQNRTIDG